MGESILVKQRKDIHKDISRTIQLKHALCLYLLLLIVQLSACFSKDLRYPIYPLLCLDPISRVNRIPDGGEEGSVITRPCLRSEDDMLELCTVRYLPNESVRTCLASEETTNETLII